MEIINRELPLSRLFPTILVLILAASCSRGGEPQANGGKPPGFKVKLAAVESGTIDKVYDVGIANLLSRKSVTLLPQVDGQVTNIFVKYGDQVAAGAPIIQVDPAKQQASVNSYQAATESARADIANAQATLKSLEAQRLSKVSDLKFNQQQYQRYATLYNQGATTLQNVDQYRNSLDAARASLDAIDEQIRAQQASIAKTQRALQQSQENVKQQQVQLQYYKITAPFAGTVGDIPVKIGDYVTTATKLTTINQNQPLEVRMSIPVEIAPQVHTGMLVRLLDQQSRVIGTSKVFFISPNIRSEDRSVIIKSLYDNTANQLRTDGYVSAQVVLDEHPGVLVPTTAISRIGGQSFVFVAQTPTQSEPAKSPQEQSKPATPKLVAKQKPVKLGDIRGNEIQVIEGLQPGEKIVTAGILNLTDGAPIIPES